MSDAESGKVRLLRPVEGKLSDNPRPIVLELKKTKKAKRGKEDEPRFSPELADIQRVGTDTVSAARKAANALVKGIETYERERNRSMREKPDGAIEDFVYNAGKAASVYMKEAADIPVDLAESVRRSDYQKRLRKRLRRISKAIRNWQM
jgi:hypothetical protein